MKKRYFLLSLLILGSVVLPLKADFGDADFREDIEALGSQSYHDAWCKKLRNNCRVRFQGRSMWVEGQGGINRAQLISVRREVEGTNWGNNPSEYYYYVRYLSSKTNQERVALFLFSKRKAARDFGKALYRFQSQEAKPIPNYRYPNSQGPQDTHGRDKGLNPYDNPPINDWSKKTTKESPAGINCDSRAWRNKPQCIDD
tara:strand:+ start:228 stop:827 length:600 start_codon:yes stop_codon:yes gene_type:complete